MMSRKKSYKRYKWDPLLMQIAKGLAESAEAISQGTVKIQLFDDEEIQNGEVVHYHPINNPVNFMKNPLGTNVRQEMRNHLSMAAEEVCVVLELCRKYPWLLSKEDTDYLEETWMRINRIPIRKKG